MARELKRIDITNVPELLRIAEEVQASQEPRVLRRDSEDLAVVRPIKPSRRRVPPGRATGAKDPLWSIVGIGRSEGPTDISENVDKYLAEAYAAEAK
jgi:hypothetical protein